MKTIKRLPKPLYFYQRWKTATNERKRSYFEDRLKAMGINPNQWEVVTAFGDIAVIAMNIANIAVHVREHNWKTGKMHISSH